MKQKKVFPSKNPFEKTRRRRGGRGVEGVDDRGLAELIQIAWKQVDLCITKLEDEETDERHKLMWSQNLAAYISRLDKLLWKAGAGKIEKEDLAKLLSKIPERYRKIVETKIKRSTRRSKHGKSKEIKEA